jgi:hypothetical protein
VDWLSRLASAAARQRPKQAVLDYLRTNQIQVREVMKGERDPLPPAVWKEKLPDWMGPEDTCVRWLVADTPEGRYTITPNAG